MTRAKARREASLLAAMADGEWYSTAELAQKLGYSQSNIRRHLVEAIQARLVEQSSGLRGSIPWYRAINSSE